MLHYFVKIHNVRMSFLGQKKNQTYSYFVSLNSVFKDATIFIVNGHFIFQLKNCSRTDFDLPITKLSYLQLCEKV